MTWAITHLKPFDRDIDDPRSRNESKGRNPMDVYAPQERLEDYRMYLTKKILRLKRLLDREFDTTNRHTTVETLRQLEADLFKLRNVRTLIDMKRAA